MSTVRQRIRFAFIANGIGRVMRVAEQLALVPLLLLGWGVERYGEWIALYSIAVFAALAHPGIGVAAYSDIVIQFAGGNRRAAVRSFTTAIVLMVVTVVMEGTWSLRRMRD